MFLAVGDAALPREHPRAGRSGPTDRDAGAGAAALERLEAEYDRFEAARSEPDVEFRRVREKLPFALVLFDDDKLGFFAYDDGVLVGAAFSDDEDVVRWGERRFERRYERSDPA